MGLRFRRSISVAPGVKLNVNKKSVGASVGTRGARLTGNSKGQRTTSVGLPGTGLSYRSTKGPEPGGPPTGTTPAKSAAPAGGGGVLRGLYGGTTDQLFAGAHVVLPDGRRGVITHVLGRTWAWRLWRNGSVVRVGAPRSERVNTTTAAVVVVVLVTG